MNGLFRTKRCSQLGLQGLYFLVPWFPLLRVSHLPPPPAFPTHLSSSDSHLFTWIRPTQFYAPNLFKQYTHNVSNQYCDSLNAIPCSQVKSHLTVFPIQSHLVPVLHGAASLELHVPTHKLSSYFQTTALPEATMTSLEVPPVVTILPNLHSSAEMRASP